jgi:hypothetical protein
MDMFIQPLCIALTLEVFMHHAGLSRCYFLGCNGRNVGPDLKAVWIRWLILEALLVWYRISPVNAPLDFQSIERSSLPYNLRSILYFWRHILEQAAKLFITNSPLEKCFYKM